MCCVYLVFWVFFCTTLRCEAGGIILIISLVVPSIFSQTNCNNERQARPCRGGEVRQVQAEEDRDAGEESPAYKRKLVSSFLLDSSLLHDSFRIIPYPSFSFLSPLLHSHRTGEASDVVKPPPPVMHCTPLTPPPALPCFQSLLFSCITL